MPYIKARIRKKQGGIVIHAAIPFEKFLFPEERRIFFTVLAFFCPLRRPAGATSPIGRGKGFCAKNHLSVLPLALPMGELSAKQTERAEILPLIKYEAAKPEVNLGSPSGGAVSFS